MDSRVHKHKHQQLFRAAPFPMLICLELSHLHNQTKLLTLEYQQCRPPNTPIQKISAELIFFQTSQAATATIEIIEPFFITTLLTISKFS